MSTSLSQTQGNHSVASLLSLLRGLTEPTFVVHVGAGRGVGELHTWQTWDLPKALIVEPDVTRLDWAQRLCSQHTGWKIATQVISNEETEVEYHLASNPDEDSLVPTHRLSAIWVGIRTVKVQSVSATSLDKLLGVHLVADSGQHKANLWCLIDCFPSDLILLSAEHSLAQMSVVVARVVLTDSHQEDSIGSLSSVSLYLQVKGFKCLSVIETTHPSVGYAIFVRDFKAIHEQYRDAVQAQLQTEQTTVMQQSELINEQRLQLERLAVDRDIQLEAVANQAKTIEAQQIEISELSMRLDKMEAVLEGVERGKLALQGQQTHLHDDLVRAEAQIDLIKELIFTSPPLQG